jgi:hypothetical protein
MARSKTADKKQTVSVSVFLLGGAGMIHLPVLPDVDLQRQ